MEKEGTHLSQRRQRLHELLIALINREEDLQLIDAESPRFDGLANSSISQDPGKWLDRNRRILSKYQSLVRSAITLDALLDSEQIEDV